MRNQIKAYPEVEPGSDQETLYTLPSVIEMMKVVDSVISEWNDFASLITDQTATDAVVMINDINALFEPDRNESQIFQDFQDEDKFI